MMKVMEYVIANEEWNISTQVEWCEAIGYHPSNIVNIRNGKQSFGNENIRLCCITFNISADYIYGLTDQMFRISSKQTPIQRIEAALRELKSLK